MIMLKRFSVKDLMTKDNKTSDILYFIGVIAITHVLWKILITGDEYGHQVAFAGKDMTDVFYKISLFTADISWRTLHYIFGLDFKLNGVEIVMRENNSVIIIWACSAVKQIYMLICLILFYPNVGWKKKVLYTLFGAFILELFNIMRIDIVIYGCYIDKNNYDFLHKTTQYGFYVVMFLLWILWIEKIIPEKKSHKDTKDTKAT